MPVPAANRFQHIPSAPPPPQRYRANEYATRTLRSPIEQQMKFNEKESTRRFVGGASGQTKNEKPRKECSHCILLSQFRFWLFVWLYFRFTSLFFCVFLSLLCGYRNNSFFRIHLNWTTSQTKMARHRLLKCISNMSIWVRRRCLGAQSPNGQIKIPVGACFCPCFMLRFGPGRDWILIKSMRIEHTRLLVVSVCVC